jgi:hypothetical protein
VSGGGVDTSIDKASSWRALSSILTKAFFSMDCSALKLCLKVDAVTGPDEDEELAEVAAATPVGPSPRSARSVDSGASATYLRMASPECRAKILILETSIPQAANAWAPVTRTECPPNNRNPSRL